jgi:hypothetical protein
MMMLMLMIHLQLQAEKDPTSYSIWSYDPLLMSPTG